MSATLRQITGWAPRKYSVEFEDPLAFNKFVVFALVSSLLVPKAAKSLQRALQDERTQTLNEHCRLRMLRKCQREKDESVRLQNRIDEVHTALFDSCYSADATATNVSESRPPFPPPHWAGDERPHGARRVRQQTRFPSLGYLTYLVQELGYEGSAAFAAIVQGHQPWLRVSDRRHANSFSADQQLSGQRHQEDHSHSDFTSAHPYYEVSPARRTKVGGGLTLEQVQQGLNRMRQSEQVKAALVEIVYKRRSTLQVADESSLRAEILYVYASRLRGHIRASEHPDVSA